VTGGRCGPACHRDRDHGMAADVNLVLRIWQIRQAWKDSNPPYEVERLKHHALQFCHSPHRRPCRRPVLQTCLSSAFSFGANGAANAPQQWMTAYVNLGLMYNGLNGASAGSEIDNSTDELPLEVPQLFPASSLLSMPRQERRVKLDWSSLQDIQLLTRCARIWPAALLVALAVIEGLAVSQAGKLSAQFYQIFVDGTEERFRAALLQTTGMWSVVCVTIAISYFLGQALIIHWRRRISTTLHVHYFHNETFFKIRAPDDMSAHDAARWTELPEATQLSQHTRELDSAAPLLPPGAAPWHAAVYLPDNPDQRMTEDVALFCAALERGFQQYAKAPFNLLLFSFLTIQAFHSVLPLLCALAFFCACAVLHRMVVGAIAGAVYTHTRAEGDLRSAHVRVRDSGGAIAAWGGGGVEKACVDAKLATTLRAQLSLAWAYTAQTLVQRVRLLRHNDVVVVPTVDRSSLCAEKVAAWCAARRHANILQPATHHRACSFHVCEC
jgi:ABC transporter transmembrane region 2